jgi:hypothetical protein
VSLSRDRSREGTQERERERGNARTVVHALRGTRGETSRLVIEAKGGAQKYDGNEDAI